MKKLLGQYDFSGDTATAADNLESAYRGSLQSQSPAQRMVPLGNDVSAGVGQGMTQYSFAGDSSTTASNLISTLSASLAAQKSVVASSARGIGTAITSGIASGIRSGQSAVIQAAVTAARSALAAAKAALAIHSPSGVFRDEVGLMAMKGIQQYGTQENYAKHQSIFLPYAYLTPDGEWHETGRMGWWGLDDATAESREKFRDSFETFLEEAKAQNLLITIVDCHI